MLCKVSALYTVPGDKNMYTWEGMIVVTPRTLLDRVQFHLPGRRIYSISAYPENLERKPMWWSAK